MNILFFLIPKSQVGYVMASDTFRQVAEKLDYLKYTAIPILDENGKYIDTVSEGDLFWFVKKHPNMTLKKSESVNILSVTRNRKYVAIRYDASMSQNFVPVLDDHDIFMGIITRKAIIGYFAQGETSRQ